MPQPLPTSKTLENGFIYFIANSLTFKDIDFEKISKNIKLFIGEHNFKYFIKTGSDTDSTVRVVYNAFAYRYKDFIVLHFEANGYLRTQIRFMVSALLNLDENKILDKLNCKKNHQIKPALSNGLYLAKIKY